MCMWRVYMHTIVMCVSPFLKTFRTQSRRKTTVLVVVSGVAIQSRNRTVYNTSNVCTLAETMENETRNREN